MNQQDEGQSAQCRLPGPPTQETAVAKPLLDAVASVWDLFDQAHLQANKAMEPAGVPRRIVVNRTNNERR